LHAPRFARAAHLAGAVVLRGQSERGRARRLLRRQFAAFRRPSIRIGAAYRAVKETYDPVGRLPDLHDKCVRVA
jgi:hypothetical protein